MRLQSGRLTYVAIVLLALAVPVQPTAQGHPGWHNKYRLIDLGTFGGPNSSFVGAPPGARLLNNYGAAVGGADTSTPDSDSCWNFDCYLSYGFRWKNGVAHHLGALPGFNSSFPFWVSDNGLVAGLSENGIDPLTGVPAQEAVLWRKNGTSVDLGTLGGNNSVAAAVNDAAQVVGAALNTVPDPYTSLFLVGGVTQAHAFLWQQGAMRDLGTLGGADSIALDINDRGQVAGWSFTNSIPNDATGYPKRDPFFWEEGKMFDIGTLGGVEALSYALNNKGQVVGASLLAGDAIVRPFSWRHGVLTDLGTLGGDSGAAFWLNDLGDVVGWADLPGNAAQHAFLWQRGKMRDLGTLDQCSYAFGINTRQQVIGTSEDCSDNTLHVFLWEHGSMVDLNSLVVASSDVTLEEPLFINDRGEIAANGVLPNGDIHAVILIPCDENHPHDKGCEGGARSAEAIQANREPVPLGVHSRTHPWIRNRGIPLKALRAR